MLSTYIKRVKSALKRSFEVEESDSSHSTSLIRRSSNPVRSSSSSSTSSQRSYDTASRNSDYSNRSSPSESSNLRSPKTGMKRMEFTGGRNHDTVSSRRTEMSIEVSSKQIDNSPSAGIARFGLKRPEVSLSSRINPADSSLSNSSSRRGDINATRPQEPPAPPRRMDSHLSSGAPSRIPRAESQSPVVSPVETSFKRPELPVFKQSDDVLENNNNNHHPPAPTVPLPSLVDSRGDRVHSPVSEPPPVRSIESK
ncbi:septin-9-like isoform X2 [Boleophthalmus pectinirostris]|uniref:septin-9-like isoform X2 n=1 Tax=Boleophthalmus pectinirostris TaxID=150288 RepID=UPI0024321219|nr:septin-9-like isoform X2 [Boleophthalmus pectinirostris]